MAIFAKRHYESIARVMQDTFPPTNRHEHDQWTKTVMELSDLFKRDNSQFDQSRFCRACVPGANVRARKAA